MSNDNKPTPWQPETVEEAKKRINDAYDAINWEEVARSNIAYIDYLQMLLREMSRTKEERIEYVEAMSRKAAGLGVELRLPKPTRLTVLKDLEDAVVAFCEFHSISIPLLGTPFQKLFCMDDFEWNFITEFQKQVNRRLGEEADND